MSDDPPRDRAREAAPYDVRVKADGPAGALPFTPDMLLSRPSGDIFGLSQNAGMGWNPADLHRPEFLILSTQGGIRGTDGTPVALGYHTGHWEVGLLMQEAARVLSTHGALPFAGYVSDPCDGRTQGTTGMMDSLPYRNDAAMVLRRLIRSLPTRRGVLGVATCDKGLPAMLMALSSFPDLPTVIVPGGVKPLALQSECGFHAYGEVRMYAEPLEEPRPVAAAQEVTELITSDSSYCGAEEHQRDGRGNDI